ncbi:adenosine deaminase [Agromyces sp. ISL-38]|uniref:adenosine deaminase n=1 Tax=Agromyces sp. ISL-38 TaxID=2819107 RepID=UPI001BE78511|nr:adenosine deaminase [Agromyces sp. ISL-38]MBT2499445.1 adenosine deaminase [Agromyces sp. ISL-38]MBT2518024.1 adenosine deaminase [Streptomyces sp. ISL-90]
MLINLHSHLEGRVRPSTAAELASGFGLPEPPEGWKRAFRLDRPGDLTVYLAKVAASYPFFRRLDTLERIAREAVEDAAAAGQDYLELRFGPATHADDERGLAEVIAAVCRGMAAGSVASGMPSGAVVAALRHHDADTNLALARAAAGAGVCGFDLAGDESRFPRLDVHVPAFAVARAAGLGITCHAAEAGPASAVQDAVRLLGATRIGHGAHLVDAAEVLAWAAAEGVFVEVCPTSNWYTGAIPAIARHPAPTMREAGVRVVLGDDNPMQTGSDLAGERAVLVAQLGWGAPALAALDRAGVDAAFLEPEVRRGLLARLDD